MSKVEHARVQNIWQKLSQEKKKSIPFKRSTAIDVAQIVSSTLAALCAKHTKPQSTAWDRAICSVSVSVSDLSSLEKRTFQDYNS
jgi:hypothetical protein